MKVSNVKVKPPTTLNLVESSSETEAISVFTESTRGEYHKISIKNIRPYKNQARKSFDEEELKSLSNTIKRIGIRQPLTVIRVDNIPGFYEVVSGERRLRAAELAGLDRVPCIILDNVTNADEIALVENIQRADLHPIELAEFIYKLYQSGRYSTHEDLAKAIGFSRSKVSELISLANLPQQIRHSLLQQKSVPRELIRELNSESNPAKMQAILERKQNLEVHSPKRGAYTRKPTILRITADGDGLELFSSRLDLLNEGKKERLKSILEEIIGSL